MVSTARPRSAFRDFIRSESSAGLVLMGAAVVAMVLANSPLGGAFSSFLHMATPSPALGALPGSVDHWINDGLMAIFFLLVGLEIKRELVDGHLSTWSRRLLPGMAAIGGMVVPALIYLAINLTSAEGIPRGWAVPAATDIAFALGVLSLLGKRAPVSLKIFLTALAIIDDLGAIVIIALFYSEGLNWLALGGAGLVAAMMLTLNRMQVVRLWPYLLLALVLWWFVYISGIHATVAGVVAALTIPVRRTPAMPEAVDSPLHRLEHALQPWVAFAILPIFGLANAGVRLADLSPGDFIAPAPLGVALGLFLGKQLGVFAACAITVRFRLCDRPAGASWLQVYGVGLLCGIGFTMSLFISLLAFANDPETVGAVKLGVLTGSILSGIVGAGVLYFAKPFDLEADRLQDEAGRPGKG